MKRILILAAVLLMITGTIFSGDLQVFADDEYADGTYPVEFTFEGGTGKGGVEAVEAELAGGEVKTLVITMTSPNYDYCIYYGEQYINSSKEGNSVFTVPYVEESFLLTADTVAMSQPHEIDYTVTLNMDSLWKAAEKGGVSLPLIAGIAIVVVVIVFFAVRAFRKRAR
jgi:hypothetical protein